jgi:two-component system, OmpR family, torCAD operon response regulator TorR
MSQRIAVLLVDDDPAQCETMADILSDHGCEVLPCSDPSQAVTLGCSSRFDLVLLDLKMAGIDGIDLLRRIRHLSHGCIMRRALTEGADAVLTKPVDIPQLLEIARDVQTTGDCKATASLVPSP